MEFDCVYISWLRTDSTETALVVESFFIDQYQPRLNEQKHIYAHGSAIPLSQMQSFRGEVLEFALSFIALAENYIAMVDLTERIAKDSEPWVTWMDLFRDHASESVLHTEDVVAVEELPPCIDTEFSNFLRPTP